MPLLFKKDGIQIVITPLNILRKQNVASLAAMGIEGVTVTAENANRQTFKVSIMCHHVLIQLTILTHGPGH